MAFRTVMLCVTFASLVAKSGSMGSHLPPAAHRLPSSAGVTNDSVWSLPGNGKYITKEVVDVDGMQALRLVTLPKPNGTEPRVWDAALEMQVPFSVSQGDTGLLLFTARASPRVVTNETIILPVVQANSTEAYYKSLDEVVQLTSEFMNYSLPFAFAKSEIAGQTKLQFELAFQVPQSLDLANVQLWVWSASQNVDPKSLPSCCGTSTYPGRAANASWRVEALARIDEIRRGSLTVNVNDLSGKPVSNCTVNATMERSAFRFGSALNEPVWLGAHGHEFALEYKQHFLELFDTAVFESDMKWPNWNGTAASGHNNTLAIVKFLLDQGIRIRGHNLVWPSCGGSGKVPATLCAPLIAENTTNSRDQLQADIIAHINDEVSTLKSAGCCEEFDVVNEPFGNSQIVDFLGKGNATLISWLAAAKTANPDAGRRLNEDRVCSAFYDMDSPQQAYYHELVPFIMNQAPGLLTGLGCESHLDGTALPAPESMIAWYNWIGSMGITVRVTEFDVSNVDEQLYADYLRDTLIAAYSSSAADGFLMWGFIDSVHWLKSAPLYKNGWVPKLGLSVWQSLVLGEWKSRETGKTSNSGVWVSPPLHHGAYSVSVVCDGAGVGSKSNVTVFGDSTDINLVVH